MDVKKTMQDKVQDKDIDRPVRSGGGALRARLALVAAMMIFGTTGILRRGISLPSSVLSLTRAVIGTVFLSALLKLKGRALHRGSGGGLLRLSGALLGFNWILLFEAYQQTSVTLTTLCYAMAPIMVILASPFLLHERLTARRLLCAAAALTGMVLASGVLGESVQGGFGILLALGGAFLYAMVTILNKKISGVSGYDRAIVQLGSAAAVLLPYALLTEDWAGLSFTPSSILLLGLAGVLHTGIAYALFLGSIERLKAQTAALLSYIDPIMNIVLAALVLGEDLGAAGMAGAVLVLGSAFFGELGE